MRATTAVRLAKNEILTIDGGKGSRVHCHGGSVWITQDGDRRDVFIDAGESFNLDRPGPALVSAYAGEARVSVEAVAARQPDIVLHVPTGSWRFSREQKRPAQRPPLRLADRLSGFAAQWLGRPRGTAPPRHDPSRDAAHAMPGARLVSPR